MTDDELEHRHGMIEFHSRLVKVETKQDSIQQELREFKDIFRRHDIEEAGDRQKLLDSLKSHGETLGEVKSTLAETKGFKNGAKAAALAIVMLFGGLITLALKKWFGL